MQVLTGVSASQEAVIAHYQRVAPLLEARFGAIPIVWAAYPFGPEKPPPWHVHYFGHWTKLSAEVSKGRVIVRYRTTANAVSAPGKRCGAQQRSGAQ